MPSMRASRTPRAVARVSIACSRAARCAWCRRSRLARSLHQGGGVGRHPPAGVRRGLRRGQLGGGLAGRLAPDHGRRPGLLAARRLSLGRGQLRVDRDGSGAGGGRVLVLVGRLPGDGAERVQPAEMGPLLLGGRVQRLGGRVTGQVGGGRFRPVRDQRLAPALPPSGPWPPPSRRGRRRRGPPSPGRRAGPRRPRPAGRRSPGRRPAAPAACGGRHGGGAAARRAARPRSWPRARARGPRSRPAT